MEPLNKYPADFFKKYKEKPETLFEYNPEMQLIADKYIDRVGKLLNGIAEVKTIGSVVYKILSADVEIAVYPINNYFERSVEILKKEFGQPIQEQSEFVRFQIDDEKYEFNIHVYTGYEALVVKSLTKYMQDHPSLIEEYRKIKEKYCYLKREYVYQKQLFFNKIIEDIPDDYVK